MLRKQDPEHFYTYPDHITGLRGVRARLLHRLGFDYLTASERIEQLRIEATYWREKYDVESDAHVRHHLAETQHAVSIPTSGRGGRLEE